MTVVPGTSVMGSQKNLYIIEGKILDLRKSPKKQF